MASTPLASSATAGTGLSGQRLVGRLVARGSHAAQRHDRDPAGRFPLVFGEAGVGRRLQTVQPVPLWAGDLLGRHLEGLRADFDPGAGVGFEVVVPGGVLGATAAGAEDDETV